MELLGRIFFVSIFLFTAPENFKQEKIQTVAAKGLPMASLLVPVASALAVIGALSVLFGVEARWGAWLIIIFLVPVTLFQHNYWSVTDPMKRRMQYLNFLKNVSLTGGAIFIAVYGSGPLSLDQLF